MFIMEHPRYYHDQSSTNYLKSEQSSQSSNTISKRAEVGEN